MRKLRLLILGAGVMQGPALTIARDAGYETIAVDGDAAAPNAGLADRFEKIDLKDKETIESFARRLKDDAGLAGVMTAGTDFSASVAWVAERLGLPGIPYETALNASDKERMRKVFAAHGVPSPEFIIIEGGSLPPASGPAKAGPPAPPSAGGRPPATPPLPFPFPVVVKPVDNMGARGCRRVDTDGELAEAVADALRYSRSGRAIVEEYMDGPEFSVDALVYKGEITICGLADRHIFFPPYFIETGHTMPTTLPEEKQKLVLDAFIAGIRALGIDNGAAKGDVKLTSKGPMIGEIAARLSGGYMSGWTYPYASGANPTLGAIEIACGKKPSALAPTRAWTCAERAFISIPGEVASVEGLDAARNVPGVKDLFLRVKAGSRVTFPVNNVTKCGNVIAALPLHPAACAAAEEAARKILIRLKCPDKETEDFLTTDHTDHTDRKENATTNLTNLTNGEGDGRNVPSPFTLHPFFPPDAFAEGPEGRDWAGRTVEETLQIAREMTGREPPVKDEAFMRALLRGGYQGAVYYMDREEGRG